MKLAGRQQKGAALIVALLFLVLISLVAITGAETSTLQLQMAGNEQSRLEAQQQAMAVIDAIMDDTDNAPIVGGIGFKICDTADTDASCDLKEIELAPETIGPGSVVLFQGDSITDAGRDRKRQDNANDARASCSP